jgi:hypothetical protein
MKQLILILAVALTACGVTPPPKPETITQQVYCVTPEQFQALVDAAPKKIGNSIDKDARAANVQLTAQNILVRQYADGLLKVIGGCIGPAPSDA